MFSRHARERGTAHSITERSRKTHATRPDRRRRRVILVRERLIDWYISPTGSLQIVEDQEERGGLERRHRLWPMIRSACTYVHNIRATVGVVAVHG